MTSTVQHNSCYIRQQHHNQQMYHHLYKLGGWQVFDIPPWTRAESSHEIVLNLIDGTYDTEPILFDAAGTSGILLHLKGLRCHQNTQCSSYSYQ